MILFRVGVLSDTYVGDILQCNTTQIIFWKHCCSIWAVFLFGALLVKLQTTQASETTIPTYLVFLWIASVLWKIIDEDNDKTFRALVTFR